MKTFTMLVVLLIVAVVFIPTVATSAPLDLEGTYDENTDAGTRNWNDGVWNNADGYRVVDDIIVENDGVVVTIAAGTVFGFDGEFKMTFQDNAQLVAMGTEGNHIVFTNGDDAATNYGLVDWEENEYEDEWCYLEILVDNGANTIKYNDFLNGGIRHAGDVNNEWAGYVMVLGLGNFLQLEYCTFTGPDVLAQVQREHIAALVVDEAELVMQNCETIGTHYGALAVYSRESGGEGFSPDMVVSNCEIHGGNYGITVMENGGATITIKQNLIYDCSILGIDILRPNGPAPDENPELDDLFLTIKNNTIYNCELAWGILVVCDPTADEDLDISNNTVFGVAERVYEWPWDDIPAIEVWFTGDEDGFVAQIKNNVCWHNEGSGFSFNGLAVGDEGKLTFVNNISGDNGWGVTFNNTGAWDYDIYNLALKENGLFEAEAEDWYLGGEEEATLDETTCVIVEEGEVFSLVNEAPDGDDWDFHLLIEEVVELNELINTGGTGSSADPDGSGTDFGVFGGELAEDNIDENMELLKDYCCIPALAPFEFPDESTLLYDTYWVLGDCEVLDTEEFTIEAGTTIKFEESAEFSVIGTLTSDGTAADSITFTTIDPADTWDGIILEDGSVDSRFDYCEIEKATNGIKIDSETLTDRGDATAPIKNCNIHDCTANGIYLRYSGTKIGNEDDGCTFSDNTQAGVFIAGEDEGTAGEVHHSTFNDEQIGVKLSSSDATVDNCTFNDCSLDGISTYLGSEYDITNNTFNGSVIEGQTGIFFLVGGGADTDVDNNVIQNCDFGIEAYSSTPQLTNNIIGDVDDTGDQNNIGLNLFSNSVLRMTEIASNENHICHNDEFEIQVSGEFIPDIDDGHNNIYNDDDVPYIYCSIDWTSAVILEVEQNWWGDVEDAPGDIGDLEDKCQDSVPDDLPLDFEDTDPVINSFDNVYLAFQRAAEFEREDDWENADAIYREICEDHSDSYYAKLSLQRIYNICAATDGSFAELRRFFTECGAQEDNEEFCKRANDMAAYAMVRNGDYEDAIGYYEDIIENEPTFRDSVYAVIDAGLAYYDAFLFLGIDMHSNSVDGEKKLRRIDASGQPELFASIDEVPLFGSISSMRPKNEIAMYVDIKNLLNEISSRGSMALHSPASPTDFVLMQNYPNPFNNVTNVQFGIPEVGHVKLALFDISGRQVKLLNDRAMQPGMHQISFDAQDLSSGTYILRLDANGGTQSIPTMLIR